MSIDKRLPELLLPAGGLDRLYTAFRYGADACYVGAKSMSLRSFADNFTLDELQTACAYAHSIGRRVYVACNAFARDDDIAALPELVGGVCEAGADALIVNDPGVIRVARRTAPGLALHLSTQANTLNSEAALFWHEQGVKRIILARELSLDEISVMRASLPASLELEAFVHGAMCVSYSGRCLLSNYIAGRDSNRGECAQPCRWRYELRERGSDGEYLPIEQDERGTFILNSRDMNMIEHIPELIAAGVSSLKIEGRMKSTAYVATLANAYRMALECCARGSALPPEVIAEPYMASHRPFTTGFAFGEAVHDGQATNGGGYVSDAVICAVVLSYDENTHTARISQRNRFFDGDELNILAPGDVTRSFCVNGMRDACGNPRQSAPHPMEELYLDGAPPMAEGDILRKRVLKA